MSNIDGVGTIADADIRIFESGNLADATVVCGDRTWKVHKLILSTRCKWFHTAFYGKMAEASSGMITLGEKDPDLVDMLLRFIYRRSISIPTLRDGKDIPVLCVQLFRIADFFLLDELAQTAKTELAGILYKKINILDNNTSSSVASHALTEVFEAIRDAYKDRSTESLREMILNFLWARADRHFQLPETIALLDEIPALGTDLMKIRLSVDPTTNEPSAQPCPRELPVIFAVSAPRFLYTAGGPAPNHPGSTNIPCLLRRTPMTRYNLFKAVDPNTNMPVEHLSGLEFYLYGIVEMAGNEHSGIVQVKERNSFGTLKTYHVQFVSADDARYYIRSYRNANPQIRESVRDSAQLERHLWYAYNEVLKAEEN